MLPSDTSTLALDNNVGETHENRAKFLAFNDDNGPDVSQKNLRVFIHYKRYE